MYNCPEFIETLLGGWKARAAPFNVNYRYGPTELAELLGGARTRAVVYQPVFAKTLAAALEKVPDVDLLVHVDDGSSASPLPGSVPYEEVLAAASPVAPTNNSPEDLYLAFTGGTTGRPKGVLWRQDDAFVATMSGADGLSAADIAKRVERGAGKWLATPPLMHVAAQWTAFSAIHGGGTVVLHHDTTRIDAADVLDTAESEGVVLMTIVGDAYARKIVDELRRNPRPLKSLKSIATGGAPTSPLLKTELLELLPHVHIIDGYGASETGGMAFGPSSSKNIFAGFAAGEGACVLSEDRSRRLAPGDDEVGWVARTGHVPLGYLDDQTATEATFPIVDGVRYAVPGDRGRLLDDGRIELLGRDSLVINTGGEKVFVEEVEEALKRHPAVVDAVVCGRPSERWGEEVVAIVQLRPGNDVNGQELRTSCSDVLADFKRPRAFAFRDEIARSPAGKADYRWARAQAETAKMT
jgi:fatty-acyl-CoA synthase